MGGSTYISWSEKSQKVARIARSQNASLDSFEWMMGRGYQRPNGTRVVGTSCRNHTISALVVMVFLLASVAGLASALDAPDSGFCAKIVQPFNLYNCTEYKVRTFDKFVLSIQLLQRMDFSGDQFYGDVLFLHSSMMGGSSWFLASSPTPLAIADAGYSVWIGNMRTTEFSFGHEWLNSTYKEFWNWDMDELANYDFPAFVDFVYAMNSGRKFHFVGFSQGARVGLGAISYQWGRAAMLASVSLLAPVVYMANTQSRILLALNYTDLSVLGYKIGIGRSSFETLIDLRKFTASQGLEELERELLCEFTGPNCCSSPHAVFQELTGPYSATTYKNLAHITQSMKLQKFMAYDFGSQNANNVIYQSTVPPRYHLSEVPKSVPTFILYGGNDRLSTPTDIQLLISELQTQPEVLFHAFYAHMDYLFSSSMTLDVNIPLLNFIGSHNS